MQAQHRFELAAIDTIALSLPFSFFRFVCLHDFVLLRKCTNQIACMSATVFEYSAENERKYD